MLLYACFVLIAVIVQGAHSTEVCYPPYGCFNDHAPYDEALVQLPWSPQDLQTKFLFYSRPDLDKQRHLTIQEFDPKGASKVGFDPKKTTVFLTHGYVESRNRWWVPMFIDELLNNEDMNVIFIEWSNGAAFPYHQAVGNVRLVGAQLSHLIELIRNDTGLNWSRMHLIGFSLGAHMMGYAGRNLRRKGMPVPRLTALDPASPYFENKHVDRRVDPSDADFVDVIHTDGRTVIINGFGTVQPMGHIDFFPNGGYHQVGCEKIDISVVQWLACSHYRALRYYIESINSPCPYHAFPCKSYELFQKGLCTGCPDKQECPRMGYHLTIPSNQREKSVKYFVNTNTDYPYCAHHYVIEFHTGDGFLKDLDGAVKIELTGSKANNTLTLEKKYYKAADVERTTFILQDDIGDLLKIRVGHNRIVDIWFLKGVVVRPMVTQTPYVGCFNRWLNNKDDQVDLHMGKSINDC